MKIWDLIHETFSALLANKVRTSLTMLGIIIGIGSVIAMVAIGQGAQGAIESNIQSLGSNLIQVLPGSQGGPGFQVSQGRGSARTLKTEDALAIATLPLVQAVSPELTGRYQITARGANTNTSVVGTTADYPAVRNVSMAEGDFITPQHLLSLAKVAVLGPTARDDLFGENGEALGQTIRINGLQFKVIGITQAKGGTGFGNRDDIIFIPLSSAQKFLAGSDYLTNISAQIVDAPSMTEAQQEITDLLLTKHKIADPTQADFGILNQNDTVSAAASITQTFTLLLGAVAGISLLVGGIGIMNMMLTTVTERTREIGLRKAVGATRRDINLQFLAEAVILTMAGGLLGVMLGAMVSFGLSYLGVLQTKVSPGAVLLAFGVSAAIGIIFGYYPARRAAGLSPIDALRYE